MTTTRQVTTGRGTSAGTIINAERLVGIRVRCPRCDAPAATIWRRFDYFGRELPLYFTKCRRCRRRRQIEADEAAFRLLEAGVTDPMAVLHDGLPTESEGPDGAGDSGESLLEGDAVSVRAAKALAANRQRAYGKKHPLTFAARAQFAEAVGKSGDAREAERIYQHLLVDQLAAVGHQSPAVLANQYRAAVWTALAGDRSQALHALRGLLADQQRILGAEHVNTLVSRATIAQLVDEMGDRQGAIEILKEVARDQLRFLGSEHPDTEATQRLLAEWDR